MKSSSKSPLALPGSAEFSEESRLSEYKNNTIVRSWSVLELHHREERRSMLSQIWFLTKVMVGSLVIAIAIKTIAPLLAIPVTSATALIGVLGLPLIVLAVLGWHYWQGQSASSTRQ
jgi:hypothetical protein